MLRTGAGERGQATVELVALLPVLAVLGFGVWQAAVAGQAIWLAGSAARAAARAAALGDDPLPAARGVLPPRLADGMHVRERKDGGVTVNLRIPSVVGRGSLASTSAGARFVPQAP